MWAWTGTGDVGRDGDGCASNNVDKGVVKGVAGDVDVDRPHLRC